jgi:hypothetical protein
MNAGMSPARVFIATNTLRTALAAAANGSVTYVSTAFLTNLAAPMKSFPRPSGMLYVLGN